MKTSKAGLDLIAAREGRNLKAYKDTVGVWTIGVGHTSAAGKPTVKSGMMITSQECDEILARDIIKFEDIINGAVKVPLTQNEFDALVSITFNVGPKFATSTTIKRLNTGDRKGASDAIMMWNKPSGIISRRKGEQRQFLTPYK